MGPLSRPFHAAPLWIRSCLLREKKNKLFCCSFLQLLLRSCSCSFIFFRHAQVVPIGGSCSFIFWCSCSFIFFRHAQVVPIGPVAFFRSPCSLALSLSLSMLSWAPQRTKGQRSLVVLLGCSVPLFFVWIRRLPRFFGCLACRLLPD
jgi:hypothetical protein